MAENARRLARFPRALGIGLLASAALYALLEALGPRGFSIRDESLGVFMAQRWRLGAALEANVGAGTFLGALQAWLLQLSGSLQALHVPVLAAWAMEGLALSAVANRLGASRASQGAFFAAWLGAASLVQARSLLHFAMLPAFLSVALWLSFGSLLSGLLAGALVAASFLEYEAVLFALPGLAAFTYFEPRLKRRWAPWAGFFLALPFVLFVARHSFVSWFTYRLLNNHPLPNAVVGGLSFSQRLGQWFFGGQPDAYLGVWQHASFAAWALPPALWGFWTQRSRRPWLALWAVGGLLALLPAADPLEPQRAIAALPAFVLAAGLGWRELWVRFRHQRSVGLLLIALPVLGWAWEIKAFDASMRHGQALYARSQQWLALQRAPATPHFDAALLPVGLAWEATRPGAPLKRFDTVWVPVELARDLGAVAWPAQSLGTTDAALGADLLVQPPAGDLLWQDLARLRALWLAPGDRRQHAEDLRSTLPALKTPLARAAAWRQILENVAPLGLLRSSDIEALYREKIRSPWVFDYAILMAQRQDARLTWHLCWLKRRAGGDAALNAFERQVLSADYNALAAVPGAQAWPAPVKP